MNPESSFDNLMARLRAGKDEAATQVFERFQGRLVGLARGRLERSLRRKVDPEDVLQSVFKSFFIRHAAGEFEVGSWDGLWTLLTVITVRKCANQAQHYRRGRRNIQREVAAQPQGDAPAMEIETLAREPTPDEAAMLTDTVEHFMRGLDDREREIMSLSLQGETVAAISKQVQYSERSVHRALQHIRVLLLDLQDRTARGE